ncbi:MAG: efflux transporter outer membrane subunit [Alphaproteobacteria bacterium]|nr:efflux transporter outer membrane subunit [Alphaproteobacteria bacterium]
MGRNAKAFALILFSFAATGCAIVPSLGEAPQPKTISQYKTEKALSAEAPRNWPDARWWDAYGDKQLSQLIDEALRDAPTLATAEARIRQASAAAQQAGAGLYPHVGIEGSYESLRQTYNQGFPPSAIPHGFNDMADLEANLSFQLDFWGKNRALLAAATSEAEAAKLEGQQARLIVSTSVASAYADLAQLYANLDAANDALTVRTRSAELIKQRQDNGLENKGSYEQQLAAKAATEAEIEGLYESISLTRNRIAALMGASPDRAMEIARPEIQEIKSFGLPTDLPAELLGRRPDVIAAKLRAQASSSRIDAAEASFYPNVNLIGFVGHKSLGLDYFLDPSSLTAGIGPSVSLPILDGGTLRGQYRQARAAYDASVASYDSALLQALYDVANVVTSEKTLAPRIQKTEASVKASEEAFKVVNDRYKGGLTTYLAVLRAEDSLISSRRALADLKTRAFTLDVALVRALGGGFVHTTNESSGD